MCDIKPQKVLLIEAIVFPGIFCIHAPSHFFCFSLPLAVNMLKQHLQESRSDLEALAVWEREKARRMEDSVDLLNGEQLSCGS